MLDEKDFDLLKSTLYMTNGKRTTEEVKEKLRVLERYKLQLSDELARVSASIALWQATLRLVGTGTTPTK